MRLATTPLFSVVGGNIGPDCPYSDGRCKPQSLSKGGSQHFHFHRHFL